ncbi:hypothetical protein BAZOLSSOX_3028 [uncultured Gammaproteobacteria bacterium]|nr:hypothetical protein BAZOLSSOX_3028 [uncultured Gammaproteobacteria bacterium]
MNQKTTQKGGFSALWGLNACVLLGSGFEWGEFFGFDCGFGWFYFWIRVLIILAVC